MKITGADIRRYRTELGLTQTQFAEPLGFTQAALSLLEKGHTAVSAEHVEQIRARFGPPQYKPSFADFERRLAEERAGAIRGGTFRGQHLTLTVWRWEEGLDLGQDFRADQAADLITIRQPRERVVAFLMPKKSEHWAEGEIIVFEECVPTDLKDRDLALVHLRAPRAKGPRTLIALAHVLPAGRGRTVQFQPLSPVGPTFDLSKDVLIALFRVRFRGSYGTDKH